MILSDNGKHSQAYTRRQLFQLLFSFLLLFAYVAMFKITSSAIGDAAAIAAIAPVIVIAMLYGARIGIIVSIFIALVLNTTLLMLNGHTVVSAVLTSPSGLIGGISLVAVGAIIGHLHDLRDNLRSLLKSQNTTSRELKQAHAHIEKILHTAPCAIYTVDLEQRITSWNRMAEKLTGLKATDVIDRRCLDIWDCPMCKKKCGLLSADVEKPVFDKECEIVLPDSRRIVIRKSIDSIYDSYDAKIGGVEVFIDVTQIKEYQQALRKKSEEVVDFANAVAHDLKNPLAGIKGAFQLLRADAGLTLNDDARETIAIGCETSDYMQSLLNDLLETARLESGSKALAMQRVKVQEIVDSVVSRLYMQAGEKNIALQTDVPIELMADPKELTKIFMNLIGNAIAYIGNPPQPKITVGVHTENSGPVLFVRDNGMGIPEKNLPLIFDKFRRGSNVGTIKGTGLGLSITKAIVEAHGGRIWAESAEGAGTTFYFTVQPSNGNFVPHE